MSGTHHAHDNHSAARTLTGAFMLGALLNLLFVAAEVFYGIASNSVALLADAGHNFGDVLGLLLAWLANALARRTPTARFTYGFGSTSILAALFNALVLLGTAGGIGVEAIRRLYAPEPVAGMTVMVVAAIGILVNGISAVAFRRESQHDLNVRAAFVHLLGDAVVSAAVVVSGLLVVWTGAFWIDPALSLLVAAFLVLSTWRLLTQSFSLALNAVPTRVDVDAIRSYLARQDGVSQIHDLHVWPLSTTAAALTCHLVMPRGHPGDATVSAIAERMHEEFGIAHTTIQIETGDGHCDEDCENLSELEASHGRRDC